MMGSISAGAQLVTILCFSLLSLVGSAELYPERTIWFDQSCGDNIRAVWSTVISMQYSGSLAALEDTGFRKTYYDFIFKNKNNEHIDNTFQAISEDLASSKSSANTRIYCDQESRWSRATNSQVPGNEKRPESQRAWYDAENKIIYDVKKSEQNVPGCHSSLQNTVLGQTYCNARDGSDTCTITLCAKTTQLGSLGELRDRNLDLSGTEAARIDKFSLMVDSVILHELAHTIDNPSNMRGMKWIDVAYKWNNIRDMDAIPAIVNADSLAYLGFGSLIQDMGNQVNDDGSISVRG